MQLNPARGRKRSRPPRLLPCGLGSGFMQLNPARGRKPPGVVTIPLGDLARFMQLNPARGRKLLVCLAVPHQDRQRFMQLNPARGRKRDILRDLHCVDCVVYAAQPREGTETFSMRYADMHISVLWFMQLNPARGRKRHSFPPGTCRLSPRFMQLNPARGRKHKVLTL